MHLFLRENFNSNRENAKKVIKTQNLRHINFDLIAFYRLRIRERYVTILNKFLLRNVTQNATQTEMQYRWHLDVGCCWCGRTAMWLQYHMQLTKNGRQKPLHSWLIFKANEISYIYIFWLCHTDSSAKRSSLTSSAKRRWNQILITRNLFLAKRLEQQQIHTKIQDCFDSLWYTIR